MNSVDLKRRMNTIFIYGPPGSGKTTTGRLLAEALELPFLDLDQEIVSRRGVPIPQIFVEEGETGFRRLEKEVLRSLLEHPEAVIALGGGALLDNALRKITEAAGPVVCLQVPFESLVERLEPAAGQRPLLAGGQIGEARGDGLRARLGALLERRAAHYASFPLQLETGDLAAQAVAWEAQVCLGAFRVSGMGPGYDVRVQPGGLDQTGEALRQRGLRGPLALVSDENVGGLFARRVLESLYNAEYDARWINLPVGEAQKNMATVSRLWEAFLEAGLERGSTVLALGGGVVGDLAGFAAAVFLRGVKWVALPTSLLAMVDASLGGKTGADLPQGKNLVGAFHPPRLVLADPQVLSTLPVAELRSGLAEVVKHGVIGDPALFELCAQGWEVIDARREELVRRAMAVKIGVIQSDPFEQGQRAALNLGHTIGHAVELASGFQLRHGEAVAIGMVAAARLADRLGLAQVGLVERITDTLHTLGLPVDIPAGLDRAAILRAISVDKKRSGGSVRFALPVRIGEVRVGVEVGDFAWVLD